MGAGESELDMVRRHVLEGAGHVANQRALIVRLKDRGLATEEAEAILDTFEDLQRLHQAHLAKAETKLFPR